MRCVLDDIQLRLQVDRVTFGIAREVNGHRDGRENVVEVVCNPRRHLAQTLEPSTLCETHFGVPKPLRLPENLTPLDCECDDQAYGPKTHDLHILNDRDHEQPGAAGIDVAHVAKDDVCRELYPYGEGEEANREPTESLAIGLGVASHAPR